MVSGIFMALQRSFSENGRCGRESNRRNEFLGNARWQLALSGPRDYDGAIRKQQWREFPLGNDYPEN
jgi:hypothetical protein